MGKVTLDLKNFFFFVLFRQGLFHICQAGLKLLMPEWFWLWALGILSKNSTDLAITPDWIKKQNKNHYYFWYLFKCQVLLLTLWISKAGCGRHTFNPSTQKAGVGRLLSSRPSLYIESHASQGYIVRPYLKTKRKQSNLIFPVSSDAELQLIL